MLDVGSGYGSFVLVARDAGIDASGVELARSSRLRAQAAGYAPPRYDADDVYRSGDAHTLPFDDATFDVVTFWNVIEHVPRAELAIAEAAGVLRPGGGVIILAPNYATFRREAHYQVLWPPLMPKPLGRLAAVDGRLVPYAALAERYGQPLPERPLLLEGAVSGAPLALLVDDVEGEQEVMVRPGDHHDHHRATGCSKGWRSSPPASRWGCSRRRRWPAAEASLAAAVGPRPTIAAARTRVLLVEDSPATREIERRLLEDAGFEVTAAPDAEEALARLGEASTSTAWWWTSRCRG